MAKKGGVQQLQADIQTDDDFEKFLDRPGLLLMDVYSEWCGPCLGMVGSLKKIKLELGGDNLQLAICKADYITALERFRNKSEATWLFVTGGRAVNLMFGTNVPKLMQMIATELGLIGAKNRTTYDITEPQPEEVERMNVVKAAEEAASKAERLEAERKRREYLMFVTDTIMTMLPDMGVTVFGPQVHRDMFKRLMDPADSQKMQCKDRRVVAVTAEDFETIGFDSDSSKMPDEEVVEQMCKKELLVCFWKLPDEDSRSANDIFQAYSHDLTKSQPVYDDLGNLDPDVVLPPIVTPLEVKILGDVENIPEKDEPEVIAEEKGAALAEEEDDLVDDALGDILGEEPLPGESPNASKRSSAASGEAAEAVEPLTEPEAVVEEPPEQDFTKIIIVPPIWIPDSPRAHAAAIYVFFRQQTLAFLPPDPPPEPPHLIIAFEAYKRKDILDVIQKFHEEVLLYGYFTSDDPEVTTLIANSTDTYLQKPHEVTDKLVLKVAKRTSHCVLGLATHGPSYVSPNTVVGKKEALVFFPEGYKTGEMEEAEEENEGAKDKKKKKKKKKKDAEGSDTNVPAGEGTEAVVDAEEAVTPTDDSEEGNRKTNEENENQDAQIQGDGEGISDEEKAVEGEVPAEETAAS